MSLDLIFENLTNPSLLFFFLGVAAVQLKSDLTIPENSSKFISIYLLFSIGFKGGQELAHSPLDLGIAWGILLGIAMAVVVPIITFFLLRKKFGVHNAGAIAAAYGSVSAVTFVTAVSYLEMKEEVFGGHMVAVMAIMEAPSIIVGLSLIAVSQKDSVIEMPMSKVVKHSFTNGSVFLIMGSLLIGFLASDAQAQGIKPFTTDIFKGFLAVFLLDMGITSGKKLAAFWEKGKTPIVFAILMPLINGCVTAILSSTVSDLAGDRFLFAILASSASYIAVPAAMKMAVPKASPGLYLPMALAITFPFNITLGMPIYWYIVNL